MTRVSRRLTTGTLAALIVLGLLPGAVLAAAPLATAGTATTAEDTLVSITVTAIDADGDGLTFATDTDPTNGTLGAYSTPDCSLPVPDACSAEVEYTPGSNYNGPDSFTFVADDGNGGTDTATISVTVTAVNDKPDAVNDPTNGVVEDTNLTIDVLANDTDPEGDPLDISAKTDGSKGTVQIMGGGATVRYHPNTNATGTDSFTYTIEDIHGLSDTATVTVQISAQNDPPNAVDDPTNAIVEDTATLIDPLVNDTDPENDSVLVTVAGDGTKGVTTIVGGGTDVSYDPNPNATGSDSFTYTISDGNGGTDTATATVQISSVNDPPSGTDKTIATTEDTAYVFTGSDFGFTDPNDTPPNAAVSVRIASLPAVGTLTVSGSAVSVGAAPTFQQINAGFLVFTPAPNTSAAGYASFTFQVRDNGGGANLDPTPNTITIDVGGDNDAPTAVNDPTNPIVEDITTTLHPRANDTDPEGDALTITAKTNGLKGTVTIVNGGADVTYDPNLNATGTDSFTYTISDGNGGTDIGTVTVQISAVNDPPVAGDDSRTIAEDSGAGTVTVLGNDADVDGPALSVTAKTNPAHGTLTLVSGVLTYAPAADYFGPDSFDYTVSDGLLTDTATVSINVTAVNDAPEAGDDAPVIDEDSGGGPVFVLGNDSDVDGPSMTVVAKTDPAHGTLTLIAGTLTYTPSANYFGTDGFVYTVSDGVLTDTAAVTITIKPVNDAPDAVDDSATIARDAAATAVGVLGNDTDPESDPLLITAKTNGAHGTVAITGGGTGLTYDPFTGYTGADTFTYTVSDGHGGTDTATVTITVTGANRAPNAVNDVSMSVPEGAARDGAARPRQ